MKYSSDLYRKTRRTRRTRRTLQAIYVIFSLIILIPDAPAQDYGEHISFSHDEGVAIDGIGAAPFSKLRRELTKKLCANAATRRDCCLSNVTLQACIGTSAKSREAIDCSTHLNVYNQCMSQKRLERYDAECNKIILSSRAVLVDSSNYTCVCEDGQVAITGVDGGGQNSCENCNMLLGLAERAAQNGNTEHVRYYTSNSGLCWWYSLYEQKMESLKCNKIIVGSQAERTAFGSTETI